MSRAESRSAIYREVIWAARLGLFVNLGLGLAKLAGAAARRQVVDDAVFEQRQADGVALEGQEVGDRGGGGPGVFGLGHAG